MTQQTWTIDGVLDRLASLGARETRDSMARSGINVRSALGVRVPDIRRLAKEIGVDHDLSKVLWKSRLHEARILASMVADPSQVTGRMMDSWARDFDSWDVCDHCCGNLFDKTPFAFEKAVEWASRDEEFVKRAAFALMATAAVHRKDWDDDSFLQFLRVIESSAADDRNFVKTAVNWALRQIGKRSDSLRGPALEVAERLSGSDARTARWIGRDALRELGQVKASNGQ